jgi:hypothetical protein
MSNEAVIETGVPAGPGLNQIERVVDTFVAPSKTFQDILRSASWWLPFVLLALGAVVSGQVIGKQVGWDRVYQNTLAESPKTEDRVNQMAPDAKARVISIGAISTEAASYGFGVILLIVFGIYALILWGCFNFGLGAKTTFMQCYAVAWYAALPYLLLTVLTIVTLYFGGNAEAYDVKNPVATNLAWLMPDAAPMLKAVLIQIDVIKLWSLVLAVWGMAIVSKKTMTQSAVIVGGLWVLQVLMAVVPAAFS